MQSTVHTFSLKALAKANTSSADSNAQMTAIFEKIAEHKTELRAFSNDGLGLHDNIFAEESKPTNQTVPSLVRPIFSEAAASASLTGSSRQTVCTSSTYICCTTCTKFKALLASLPTPIVFFVSLLLKT